MTQWASTGKSCSEFGIFSNPFTFPGAFVYSQCSSHSFEGFVCADKCMLLDGCVWNYRETTRSEAARRINSCWGWFKSLCAHRCVFVSDKCVGKVSNNSPVAPDAKNTPVQCVQGWGLQVVHIWWEHTSISKVGCKNYLDRTLGRPVLKFCRVIWVYFPCDRNMISCYLNGILWHIIGKFCTRIHPVVCEVSTLIWCEVGLRVGCHQNIKIRGGVSAAEIWQHWNFSDHKSRREGKQELLWHILFYFGAHV